MYSKEFGETQVQKIITFTGSNTVTISHLKGLIRGDNMPSQAVTGITNCRLTQRDFWAAFNGGAVTSSIHSTPNTFYGLVAVSTTINIRPPILISPNHTPSSNAIKHFKSPSSDTKSILKHSQYGEPNAYQAGFHFWGVVRLEHFLSFAFLFRANKIS
jgi:hypothetical protein